MLEKKLEKYFIYGVLSILLTGCAVNLESYQQGKPEFSMQKFFSGKLCAWGVVRERNSQVNRKFIADIIATLDGEKVVLDERFLFDDGERQTRVWNFSPIEEQWRGTAGDVVGEAVGEVAGDTLHLTYQLRVKVDDEEYIIDMDDWLHQIDDSVLMGSTEMSKWGIDVGSIDIVIQKQTDNVRSCITRA